MPKQQTGTELIAARKARGLPYDDIDPNVTYVFSRVEDRSAVAKISQKYDRYKPFILLLGWFLVAAGFGFETPAQTSRKLDKKIDEVGTRVDTLYAWRTRDRATDALSYTKMQEGVNILLRLRCLDVLEGRVSAKSAQLAGLNCAMIFPEYAPRNGR